MWYINNLLNKVKKKNKQKNKSKVKIIDNLSNQKIYKVLKNKMILIKMIVILYLINKLNFITKINNKKSNCNFKMINAENFFEKHLNFFKTLSL